MGIRLGNLIKLYGFHYLCELNSNELRNLKGVTREGGNKTMTHNQIELAIHNLTNTHYSYYDIEDYLTSSSDDIGYNDKIIYLSNGWEEIAINFKYTLTEEYDIIIHSIN